MTEEDRRIVVASKLHRLGVSGAGVVELLSYYSLDEIELQMKYLPFRKAKRPEALIIEAVRNNYSPPKEFYYAEVQTPSPEPEQLLDEDTQPPA